MVYHPSMDESLEGSSHHSRSSRRGHHSYGGESLSQSSMHSQTSRRSRRRQPKENSSSLDDLSLHSNSSHSTSSATSAGSGRYVHSYKKPEMPNHAQYLAMDCEMVGTISGESICARVVLTDWKGRTVMDSYVKPTEVITDYRTFVSGITEDDLKDAEPLDAVRAEVQALLADKILVGHGLQNDLKCLDIDHPWTMIRDTAVYEPFMKDHHGTIAPRKLKELAKERLNREIQVEGKAHSPIEDAVAALDLYKSHRPRWEACMQAKEREAERLVRNQMRQQQMMQLQQQPYYNPPFPMAYVPSQYMS